MSVNYDGFVTTILKDDSIASPTPEPIVPGFSFLQPFFSGKGSDNVIQRFNGVGSFHREYGNDVDNVRLYGHGGLIAEKVVSAKGKLDGCRLMPEHAASATILVCVAINDDEGTVTIYQRDEYGNFLRDNNGDKIPVDDSGSPLTKSSKSVKIVTKAYDVAVTEAINFNPSALVEDDGQGGTINWTLYPIVALKNRGRGKCGNDIAIRISLDSERDGRNTDGRRYVLDIVETSSDGSVAVVGSSFDVLSFSFDQTAVAIPGSDIPDSYDIVYDDYASKYYLPLDSYYSAVNYDRVIELLGQYYDGDDKMIDIISFKDLRGNAYDRILEDVTSEDISTSYLPLVGGTDGEFDVDWLIANDVSVTNEAEALPVIEANKTQLLKDFYLGNIDQNIFDARIVDAGVTLDAWFPAEVKNTMVGLFTTEVRDDIFVYVDTGSEANTLALAEFQANAVAGNISAEYGNVAINIHNGTTTDRVRNLRTTGNYEIASALTKLYGQQGSFTVHAGYFSGKVNTMKFDFYPKVVKDDLQIKPLQDKNLLFAMKLDRSDNSYFMSDDSQYAQDYSVLGSIRNLIFAGEVMRTVKKVLVKYSFHPDNAAGAILAAKTELDSVFTGSWFPASLPINSLIYQTRNDRLNKDASVDIDILFPDVVNKWKVTIHAKRQPVAG